MGKRKKQQEDAAAMSARKQSAHMLLMRAWKPGADDGGYEARQSDQAKQIEERFNPDPDDLVYDPRTGLNLSRFGTDRGRVKRDLVEEKRDVMGEVAVVNRVADGLDRLYSSKKINANELAAAREFQKEFDRIGYDRISTTNMTGTPGGGMAIEAVYNRSKAARDNVALYLDLVGGPRNPAGVALFWYVGRGLNLEQVSDVAGDSPHFWRGALFCALNRLGADYAERRKKSRRRVRSSGLS